MDCNIFCPSHNIIDFCHFETVYKPLDLTIIWIICGVTRCWHLCTFCRLHPALLCDQITAKSSGWTTSAPGLCLSVGSYLCITELGFPTRLCMCPTKRITGWEQQLWRSDVKIWHVDTEIWTKFNQKTFFKKKRIHLSAWSCLYNHVFSP